MEPFAPTSSQAPRHSRSTNDASHSSNNNASSSVLRVVPDETAASFLSRHDIGFRLRNMEADTDDGAMDNGQDEEDASEQDDPMPAEHQRGGDRLLLNHQRSNNMDDEEIESDMDFNFQEVETESDSDDNLSTQDAQRSVQTGATHGSDTGDDCAGNFSLLLLIALVQCILYVHPKPPSTQTNLNRLQHYSCSQRPAPLRQRRRI